MIVRGPEFWGLDLIVSMGVAYMIVLALAFAASRVRAGLRGRAADRVGAVPTSEAHHSV